MSASLPVLTFEVAGGRYGLVAELLREVVRAVAITALPKAPPIVEGVINCRGEIVPVLDIRQRFSLPPTPLTPDQHFLIAESGRRVVALRVDRAMELIAVDADSVESPTEVAPGAEYVAGIVRLPDGLLVIHDLPSFLAFDEAKGLDAALGTERDRAGSSKERQHTK